MTVRIDEFVTEVAEEPSGGRGISGAETGAAAGSTLDLDRLGHEIERRCQRLARLWAD